jgi:hypothetical protein
VLAHERKGKKSEGRAIKTSGVQAMSVFGSLMSSIFGSNIASTAGATPAQQPLVGQQPTKSGGSTDKIDVAAIMDKLADETDEDLDWRHSIVDLMKLLKLDSSLTARKQLAKELQYAGNTNDSAAMNIWLHKQVMLKLAENGGQVPAEFKH